jgi:hypothetical protein
MTVLTSVTGTFRARVLAARLESEGIDAHLRGAVDGPYGLTLGEMARVDVLVPNDQVDDATFVMLIDEVDATLAPPTEWWHAGDDRPPARWPWWTALVLLTAAIVPLAGYLLRAV